jgi:molybdopterin synthase catalytic subunit
MMASDPIVVRIVDGPLSAEPSPWEHPSGAGALLTFEGIARPTEEGRPIVALDYEAYEPMASTMLRRQAESALAEHDLLGICVEHSHGRVAVGECSFRLRIASRHRKEALAAMDWYIDALKRDVPIWKSAVFSG